MRWMTPGSRRWCAPAAMSCCGPTGADTAADKARRMGYSEAELAAVPAGANLGLGCGNPQAIAAMLQKARDNAARSGAGNVEFRLGELEHLPIADNTADVVISNCVINLVPDKAQVFREAFRVLKPGGRLAVSDIVATAPLPPELREDPELLCGCVAGAAPTERLASWLAEAGFVAVSITPKPESRALIATWAPGRNLEDHIVSAIIEARKP